MGQLKITKSNICNITHNIVFVIPVGLLSFAQFLRSGHNGLSILIYIEEIIRNY